MKNLTFLNIYIRISFFIIISMFAIHTASVHASEKDPLEKFAEKSSFYGTIAIGKSGQLEKALSKGACGESKSCTQETLYPIGSLTKQFTAVALLKVVLEKYCDNDLQKLQSALHEPLIHFLKQGDAFWPDGQAPSWASTVTLHHMLSNKSGLKDVDTPDYVEFGKNPHTRSEVAALYISENRELSFTPGEKYEYSNPNFFFAGLVVERLSEKTLGDYLREEIFNKNGMNHTFLPEENMEDLFKEHNLLAKGFMYSLKEKDSVYPSKIYFASSLNQGDGGIISTVSDLIKWNHALWGTETILPNQAKNIMINPQGAPENETHYGYGIEVEINGETTLYSHEGLVPGYRSIMFYNPEKNLSLVQLSNLSQDLEEWIDIMTKQSMIQTLEEPEKTEKAKALDIDYPYAGSIYESHQLVTGQLMNEFD